MDNKYSTYRAIRFQRTNRPLGRMTWWRALLGLALLLFVFLLSGAVSKGFAARGHFKAAQTLMISPAWMEKYNPSLKAYIEAGFLYEDGDYEAALQAFDTIGDSDAALVMKSRSALNLAAEKRAAGEYTEAYTFLLETDPAFLSYAELKEYDRICSELLDYFAGGSVCTADIAETINTLTGLLNRKTGAQ